VETVPFQLVVPNIFVDIKRFEEHVGIRVFFLDQREHFMLLHERKQHQFEGVDAGKLAGVLGECPRTQKEAEAVVARIHGRV
jgi:hypothetical protein